MVFLLPQWDKVALFSLRSPSQPPRLALPAHLMHHDTIKALQPVLQEPNIWTRALDQKAAINPPAPQTQRERFIFHLCCLRCLQRRHCSEDARCGQDANQMLAGKNLEHSKYFPRID